MEINKIDEYTDWLKIVWWIILIIVGACFLGQRYDSIIDGTAISLDIIILIAWISLLLMPLFHEISFFGVKFKKEIDMLKSDLREQIVNLRYEIQNSINVRTQISPQIYLNTPSDSELHNFKEHIEEIVRKSVKEQGIEPTSEKIEAPEKSIYLFSVRHEIEKQLRRIWKQQHKDQDTNRPLPISQIISFFENSGLIDLSLAGAIRVIYATCSPAIHGEEVTTTQYNFVSDIAPELIASLKAIQ